MSNSTFFILWKSLISFLFSPRVEFSLRNHFGRAFEKLNIQKVKKSNNENRNHSIITINC